MVEKLELKSELVRKAAKISGFSERYVRMVIDGSRKNEKIIKIYTTLDQEITNAESKVELMFKTAI